MLILIIGIVVTIHMVHVGKVSDQNTSTVTAVADDWEVVPFVSVRVTDDKCTSSETSLFVREWGGTEMGCLVNKIDSFFGYSTTQVVMTQGEYDSYIRSKSNNKSTSLNSAKNKEPCIPIPVKPAKDQNEFYDMRFCGTTGGKSFKLV